MKKDFMKQNSRNQWIGSFKEVAGHTMFWLSIISYTLVAATAYNTTIFPIIQGTMPWFSFLDFMAVIIIVALIAMFIEYKYIMPSVLAFRIKQEYKHQSPYKTDLDELKKGMKAVKDKLGIVDEDTADK